MLLEVNLDIPEEFQKLHKDFPRAPECNNITNNEVSPVNQFLYDKIRKGNAKITYCEQN